MKTIENKPITKLKHSKFNRSKIESDSLLSTQVTINKKLRHNSTLTEHIISKMKKNSIIKSNNIYKFSNKNTLSFSSQYKNYYKINHFEYKEKLLDKINSYGIKSFTNHYKKISYFTNNNDKISEKKPFLIKNKKIFSFFESKEFHNLRISSNKKRKLKNKKYILKANDKINKSISILLKSFNKENINIDINNKTNINNQNNNFAPFIKDNHFKTHSIYYKNENKIVSKKTHKKNNTTNVGKIIEEFEKRIKKTNKINKDIENNRNSKSVLNRLQKNNNNRNFIKYKISSKTLTKSFKIKNDNKLNKN
jgi:hypothetical protein